MDMIEVKTSDLDGRALDWATSISLGWKMIRVPADIDGENAGEVLAPADIGSDFRFRVRGKIEPDYLVRHWSSYWFATDQLIERELISTVYEPVDDRSSPGQWMAFSRVDGPEFRHTSRLVAGLRAYVQSRLGDVVQVPAALVSTVDQP